MSEKNKAPLFSEGSCSIYLFERDSSSYEENCLAEIK